MNERQRLWLVIAGAAVITGIIVLAFFLFTTPSQKITQIHRSGTEYLMTFFDKKLTYIDNESNIRQFDESTNITKFISSVDRQLQPQISHNNQFISTVVIGPQYSNLISRLENFGGNSQVGKANVKYPYLHWASENMFVGLQPLSNQFLEEGAAESLQYVGKLVMVDAVSPNNVISQSAEAIRFQNIVFANKDKVITSLVDQDGRASLSIYNPQNWQRADTLKTNGLLEFRQASDFLVFRETEDSPVKLLYNGTTLSETTLKVPAYLVYPVSETRVCAIINLEKAPEVVVYDIPNNRVVSSMKLPEYIYKPIQLAASNERVYVSTNDSIYMIEGFVKGKVK